MRNWDILFLIAVLAVLCLHLQVFYQYTVDDAYITYLYSRNLALGEGLRMYPGNPVEANSSLLWSVILAPGVLLGIELARFADYLGVVFAIATATLMFFVTKSLLKDKANFHSVSYLALLATVFVATNSSFSLWSVYGMENGMVALLILASFAVFYREMSNRSGLASALLITALYMSRPEAFGYALVFIVVRIAFFMTDRRALGKWFVSWLLVLIALIVLYEVWGYLYYGYLLPNSAVAKVGAPLIVRITSGIKYTILAGPASVLIGLGFILCLLRTSKIVSQCLGGSVFGFSIVLLSGLLGIHTAFVLLAGGDWMPNSRFWSHIVPIGALYFVAIASCFPVFQNKIVLAGLLVPYVALQLYASNHHLANVVELDNAQTYALDGMAERLNLLYKPGDIVAASDIGLLAFNYRGEVLDWWGLGDVSIGRSSEAAGRISAETILKRNPDYVILYSNKPTLTAETTKTGMARYSRTFVENEEFMALYQQIDYRHFWRDRYHVLFALR